MHAEACKNAMEEACDSFAETIAVDIVAIFAGAGNIGFADVAFAVFFIGVFVAECGNHGFTGDLAAGNTLLTAFGAGLCAGWCFFRNRFMSARIFSASSGMYSRAR